jgi:hypothetical protein
MAEVSYSILNQLDEIQARTGEYDASMAGLLHETIGGRADRMLKALSKQ